MIAVIQRVTSAKVTNIKTSKSVSTDKGYVVLLGVSKHDTEADATKISTKLKKLRLMSDENDKLNLTLNQTNADLLIVSQFTLLGDVKRNNRPSFSDAADPNKAKELYQQIIEDCKKDLPSVKTGFFGEYMHLELINDGPVTLILDSTKL